jgi:hypothetical protein
MAIAGTRDVLLLPRHAAGGRLGEAVHAHGQERRSGGEPQETGGARAETDATRDRDDDQRHDLESRYRYGNRKVAEHEEGPRHRCREQLALGAVLAVHDHGQAREHRVQRDQQADRADRDEGLVGAARV